MPGRRLIAAEVGRLVALGYPKGPELAEEVLVIEQLWAEDLDDVNDASFTLACREYRRSPNPNDRWWPAPGRLLALTPAAKLAARFGSDADIDLAWTDFHRRVRHTSESEEDNTRYLRDPRSES